MLKLVFLIFLSLFCFSSANAALNVDKIVLVKSQRLLTLLINDQVVKTYEVSLGFNPIGAKTQQGDGKTPEGLYKIDFKKKNSDFHLALRISYPNKSDLENAQNLGISPGGDIMIHGLSPKYAALGSLHLLLDWTNGCIAVTNPEIEEIFNLVRVGTPIQIFP